MSRRWRIVIGLLAVALVVAAAGLGIWLLRSDGSDGADSSGPVLTVDELDCLDGIYANTDFALDGDDGGNLIVCHYDKLAADPDAGQSHRLASSRALSPEESAAVREAVDAAPRGQPRSEGCPSGDASPGEFFLVRTPTQVAYWVYNAECGDDGVLTIGQNGDVGHRHDTAELLDALGSTYGPLGPS